MSITQVLARKYNVVAETTGTCDECGEPFFMDDKEIAHHGEEGDIDYDKDADHVPYSKDTDTNMN